MSVSLPDMMKLANKLKRVALASLPKVGVTVLVHSKDPKQDGGRAVAIATTLPSRAHQRALLADVLAQTVIADGHELEDVAEVVAADHRAHIQGDPDN
jgi:hypothetical protein